MIKYTLIFIFYLIEIDACEIDQYIAPMTTTELILKEKKGLSGTTGAVMIQWRFDACEILTSGYNLLNDTEKALEDECQNVTLITSNTETHYLSQADSSIKGSLHPDLVTMAWMRNEKTNLYVNDGLTSGKLIYDGYGNKGKTLTECMD